MNVRNRLFTLGIVVLTLGLVGCEVTSNEDEPPV